MTKSAALLSSKNMCSHMLGRMRGIGLHVALSLLFVFLLASGLIAGMILVFKYNVSLPLWALISGILYTAILYFLLKMAGRPERWGVGNRWLILIIGLATVARLLVLLTSSRYGQSEDRLIYLHFVETLAKSGLNPQTLFTLSGIYDYYSFLERCFPLALPLRWLFGTLHVVAFQVVNIVLAAVSTCLFYLIASKVLDTQTVRYALVWYGFFPLRIWNILDYTHQIQGEFYFLMAILLVQRMLETDSLRIRSFLHGIALGVFLFFLHLQKGLDIIVLLFIGLVLMPREDPTRKVRIRGWNAATGILLAVVLFWPASVAIDHWKDENDGMKLSSGYAGFMARGWSLEKLGEYDGRLEQMDQATPLEQKTKVMFAFPLSQLAYNPFPVAGKLIPAKVLKYFLVGYASGIEEGLMNGGMNLHHDIFQGTRLFFAPLFLLSAAIGCLVLLLKLRNPCFLENLILLLGIALIITVFFGETSPRYGYYFHFILALAAGIFVAVCRNDGIAMVIRETNWRRLMGTVGIMGLVAGACMIALIPFLRMKATHLLFKDMREARLINQEIENPSLPSFLPAHMKPYLQTLFIPEGRNLEGAKVAGILDLNSGQEPGTRCCLYLWRVGNSLNYNDFICKVQYNDRYIGQYPLGGGKSMFRCEWYLEAGASRTHNITVSIQNKGTETRNIKSGEIGVEWGFVLSGT